MSVEAFVEKVATDLRTQCPLEVLMYLAGDMNVQTGLRRFADEARKGLEAIKAGTGTTAELATALKLRKTAVIASAKQHAFTLEKLLAAAFVKIETEGKRLASPGAKS